MGSKTIFGLSKDHNPPTVVQVAEAHSKLRERDATGYFEPLFALCFLFERLESQATQRQFNQTAGSVGVHDKVLCQNCPRMPGVRHSYTDRTVLSAQND